MASYPETPVDREEWEQFLSQNKSKVVVVKCYADWCGPCKKISGLVDECFEGMKAAERMFVKVNVDDDDDIASHLRVKKLPTLLTFVDGEMCDVVQGTDETEIRDLFKKADSRVASFSSSVAF